MTRFQGVAGYIRTCSLTKRPAELEGLAVCRRQGRGHHLNKLQGSKIYDTVDNSGKVNFHRQDEFHELVRSRATNKK